MQAKCRFFCFFFLVVSNRCFHVFSKNRVAKLKRRWRFGSTGAFCRGLASMPYIWQTQHMLLILVAFAAIMVACSSVAQAPNPSTTSSRRWESLLQCYAYRAFGGHTKTGTIYNAAVSPNLTGVKLAVVRLRSGSLRTRGVNCFKEFEIPTGVIVQPYVMRLALVYHDLGNWSTFYYPMPGFLYLTPVIGLLAYNAANLIATDLNELDVVASKLPISIRFRNVKPVPNGLIAMCVWFNSDGLPKFTDLVSADVCSTYRQGHFAIAVSTAGLAPSPGTVSPSARTGGKESHSMIVWEIVDAVVGGLMGLVLLALLAIWIQLYWKNKQVARMERRAEEGESLQMARVGATQAPVAAWTRSHPILESEYWT